MRDTGSVPTEEHSGHDCRKRRVEEEEEEEKTKNHSSSLFFSIYTHTYSDSALSIDISLSNVYLSVFLSLCEERK
jgi:hypothetical protein